MCFCLGSGAFSWNNKYLCPDVCGVRPHSPIGRDRGLKILVFWVRVPVGARHRHAWTCGIDRRRLFPWGRGRRLRIRDFVVCFLELSGVFLRVKRRCPRPILSGASWSGGACCRIPRTLFTAGRWGRPLPELGRPAVKSGEPIGDCLPLGIMRGGRSRFKAYLRRAVMSASMENLPAPVRARAAATAARVRTYS